VKVYEKHKAAVNS